LTALLRVIECVGEPVDDIFRHAGVDLARQLDKAGVLTVFTRLPREVERVDGDAVPAQAGAGIKRHEAERLGLGRIDDLPDVDAHGGEDDLEFVDEGDIDAAEGILEQFGGFGHPAGGHGHERLNRLRIERHGPFKAGGRVAAHHLGNCSNDAARVARVFALG